MVLSFCSWSFFTRHEQHSTDSGMHLHYYYKLIGSYPASLLSTSARKGKANIEHTQKFSLQTLDKTMLPQ